MVTSSGITWLKFFHWTLLSSLKQFPELVSQHSLTFPNTTDALNTTLPAKTKMIMITIKVESAWENFLLLCLT